MAGAPDPARCPLCGEENACALAAGRAGETCWCVSAHFPPELLARIPDSARGRACVCARCVRAQRAAQSEEADRSE